MAEFRPPLPSFFSYAHRFGRDRKHVDELMSALSLCRRQGLIDPWDDRKIRAGSQWEEVLIERALQSRLFLLILTNRFIESEFCIATELAIARRLHASRAAAIAPILAEEAAWQLDELKDLQVIKPFEKPVSGSRRDRAWTEVARRVQEVINGLMDGTYFAALRAERPPIPPLLPFTIGRDAQAAAVSDALARHPAHRPLVCVLTGRAQGQAEFIETLLLDDGPIRSRVPAAACFRLAIDASAWTTSGATVAAALDARLGAELDPGPETADRAGVARVLRERGGVSVITCELTTSDRWTMNAVHAFIRYWREWPDLLPDQRILVFLTIHADDVRIDADEAPTVPLTDVTREAVERWLDTPAARDRFLVSRIRDQLADVMAVGESLPMQTFVKRFLPMLQTYQLPV